MHDTIGWGGGYVVPYWERCPRRPKTPLEGGIALLGALSSFHEAWPEFQKGATPLLGALSRRHLWGQKNKNK